MVSYLYNEIGKFDRAKFELHLSDCQACTDEFAELSNARFSVYEWQKLEFAQLETPEIRIPYTLPTSEASYNSGLWSWFSYSPRFAVAGLAAAAVVITFAIAAVTLGILDNGGKDVAGVLDEKPDTTQSPNEPYESNATDEIDDSNSLIENKVKLPIRDLEIESAAKPEKISSNPNSNRLRASQTPIPQETRPTQKSNISRPLRSRAAPRLNEFEDETDETLRLADMFDDIETSDRS